MFFPKPQEAKIKPTLYPGPSLLQKLQRNYSDSENFNIHHACLLKYFPKYYRNLEISLASHCKPAQIRVKLLKIVHKFHHDQYIGERKEENNLKRLLQTSRKTLKSLPKSQGYGSPRLQRHNLTLYFPRVTSLDLSFNQCFEGNRNLGVLTRSVEQKFYRAHGYFWDGNRLVKRLKITNKNLYYWVMLKKLGESKRFLKSLETLQLFINLSAHRQSERSLLRVHLIEFLKNKEVLECVTHLKFDERRGELVYYWQLIESLINSCHKLSFLSLPISLDGDQPVGFWLNLCKLENLQELELKVGSFAIFNSGIELPQSLRKMTFQIAAGHVSETDFLDIFGCADGFSVVSLEKYEIQQSFFNKWKNLQNLKVLKLILPSCDKINEIFQSFVVPLLKAIPQLETFVYKWFETHYLNSPLSLSLDVLLEGIEPLRSLNKLKISPNSKGSGSSLVVTFNPQKVYFLPNVTSIKIDAAISTNFDLKKFISTVFYNVKLKVPEMNKVIKLSSLQITCAQQFTKIIQLLHAVSEFKTVKFEMEIDFFNQTLPSLMEDFRYPIHIAKNLLLTVRIKLLDSICPLYLTEGLKQHLRIVFGQLDFTISYRENPQNSKSYIFKYPKDIVLLSNSQKRIQG